MIVRLMEDAKTATHLKKQWQAKHDGHCFHFQHASFPVNDAENVGPCHV